MLRFCVAQWVIFSAWMFYYAIMLYFGPNIFKTHASEVELKTALSDFVELDLSLSLSTLPTPALDPAVSFVVKASVYLHKQLTK